MSQIASSMLSRPTPPKARRSTAYKIYFGLGLALVGLAAVATARVVSGAHDLTSVGTVAAALASAVPIGMAALGGLWAERVGVVNIGLEGMLILGTWFGAWAGYQWGPWVGLIVGMAGGALGGMLHAVATITFGVDHIVSGVAINILAAGIARFLSKIAFEGVPGAGVTQSPRVTSFPVITVPGLSPALRDLSDQHWWLISDIAGVLGGFVTGLSVLTLIAVALVPISFYVLWRTPFGLRMRSVGENPQAAETLGVDVYTMKYIGVVVSGALAGMGGVFLVTVASNFYREGQTNGRGYIGLAAMIFGNWRPGGLAAGAGLFGFTDALQLRSGEASVHALLLLLGAGLVALGIWHLTRRRLLGAGFSLVIGGLLLFAYFGSDTVPSEFVGFAPHITTLLVLALASQRLRMPAADGQPYRKGET